MMVLVWTLPRFSVGGILCQRWPPASSLKVSSAFLPVTSRMQSPGRSSTIATSKTPPTSQSKVDCRLLENEQLRVVAALCGANLDDDAHERRLHESGKMSRPGMGIASKTAYRTDLMSPVWSGSWRNHPRLNISPRHRSEATRDNRRR